MSAPSVTYGDPAVLTLDETPVSSVTDGQVRKPYVQPHHCKGCDARWTGANTCHCTNCHGTWPGDAGFNAHRVDFACIDPATITAKKGTREGERLFVQVQRPGHLLWVSSAESPEWWPES